MTRNKLTAITLSFMLVLSAFAFAGCSNKDNDEEKASKQVQTSDETALKEKAAKMNQEEENFYGTWVATTEKAEYLYGNLELTITEDGTFTGNVTEEDFSGTWKKTDTGIRFDSELLSGELYFGDKCKMVIYDEYDTKVTLQKQ